MSHFFSFSLKNLLPLAIVGSNDTVKVGNQYVRARQYPWGVVQGKKGFFYFVKNIISKISKFNKKFLKKKEKDKRRTLFII